ncbi:lipocalin family protein [Salegentibacter sp. F188]|uniref:Lipocalin family protein n=1 Tax=Autumnicola patrickiae TaxID=3075591 RepID=A0ABU3E1L6_9FLAO|nr:lipocalin family protein [Salegentibacter sp. F188]MDT0689853.1 lipocalin family protein [Salegentibacter sp. F188]
MKKLLFLSLFLSLVIIMLSCEKDDEVNERDLIGVQWIESYEENPSEEIEIYRSERFNAFPTSRYRQMFYFESNNVCEYSVLAPNDAHYTARGTWEYDEDTDILKIYNSGAEEIYEFEVVEVTNDVLTLKTN